MKVFLFIITILISYGFAINKTLSGEISIRNASVDSLSYDYYFGEEGKVKFDNGLELSSKGIYQRQNDIRYKSIIYSIIIPYAYFKYIYNEEIEVEAYRLAITYPLYSIFKIRYRK